MKTITVTVSLSLILVLSGGAAKAGTLYSNGAVNGTIDAYAINFGDAVSDSFTLSQTATVYGVQFGLWAFPGDTLGTVDWSIGTSQFASDSGSGTSAVSQNFLFSNTTYGFDIDEASFELTSPLTLNAGTYYLTLQNADGTNGDPFYWDESDGPSLAFSSDPTLGAIGSESFTVLSPEPTLWYAVPLVTIGLIRAARRRPDCNGARV
jgi:hypothetical protein